MNSFMDSVNKWNKIIYANEDGILTGGGIQAEELWDKFGIKSAPKFKEACWSHIPEKWADEVRQLILTAQKELGDRISFAQIKEKFCRLTIYCDYTDEDAKSSMEKLIEKCIKKLVDQGVHPPMQGEQ